MTGRVTALQNRVHYNHLKSEAKITNKNWKVGEQENEVERLNR